MEKGGAKRVLETRWVLLQDTPRVVDRLDGHEAARELERVRLLDGRRAHVHGDDVHLRTS